MKYLIKNIWYPIFLSQKLKKKPIALKRLGKRFVIWRSNQTVSAAPARCPHRGANLGDGTVINGYLKCPYHGLEFNKEGSCRFRPAMGKENSIPQKSNLDTSPIIDLHGFIWLWHGDEMPETDPAWFDMIEYSAKVSAETTWKVHYSRFMESSFDFHHVPFVHKIYTPTLGKLLTDIHLEELENSIKMSATLRKNQNDSSGFEAETEVIMPSVMKVSLSKTVFTAAGTPIDDTHTWVAANYYSGYLNNIPILNKVEAALNMFVDFKLFQNQDKKIFEGFDSSPSDIRNTSLMEADKGCASYVRKWRKML